MVTFADYYATSTPPAEVKAAGYGGVILYISHQAGKCVTPASAAAARAAGLEVLLIFEDSAAQAGLGRSQGVADAEFANSVATKVGYPSDCPIFYAVDYDATSFAAIDAYFAGCHIPGGHRPVGVYGGIDTVTAVITAGDADIAWQTAAWSGGKVSGLAALYQSHLADPFDTDEELKAVTAWGGTTPVPVITPTPPVTPPAQPVIPTTGETTMLASNGKGGLWAVRPDGAVFAYDGALYYGGANANAQGKPQTLTAPIVGIASTPTGDGYVLVGADGAVYTYGDAKYLGGLNNHPEWNAVADAGPAIGIIVYPAGDPTGYAIACDKTSAPEPAVYRFPANGSLAAA